MARRDAAPDDAEREVQANERARTEMLRADGRRTLGENIEEADRVIRLAFELARSTGNLDHVR